MDKQEMDDKRVELTERAHDAIDSTSEKAKDMVEKASKSAKEYAGQASDYVHEKASVAKGKAKEVGHKVDDYANENPWKTAGIAAGLAAAAGIVLGMMMKKNGRKDK